MTNTADLYLQAVLRALRGNRTLFRDAKAAETSCLVTPDDRTIPAAGHLFVGCRVTTHTGILTQGDRLHDRVAIGVALTIRTTDVPSDRQGRSRYSDYKTQSRASQRITINEAMMEIIRSIHNNNLVLQYCQEQLCREEGPNPLYPAMTVLRFESVTQGGPQVVGPSHFRANEPTDQSIQGEVDSGLFVRLTFGGGERYRPIA